MPCTSSNICAAHEYCEPSTHQCHDCNDLCDPRYKTVERCSILCPEIWKSMSVHDLEEIQTSTETAVTPAAAARSLSVGLGCIIPVVLLLLVVVLVVLMWKRKKKHDEEQTRRPILIGNQTALLSNETKGKLSTQTDSSLGEDQQLGHAVLGKLDDINSSLSIEKSWPTANGLVLNIEQGSRKSSFTDDDNDNYGTGRDDNKHLPANDETVPKMSHPSKDCLPANNGIPFLRSNTELCPADTAEEDVSSCYDLRSDPASVCSSRQDNRNRFRQVMDAYHAIDRRAYDIPYVVQCDVGNSGLQVMIRKDYSLSQANDEIMNVIPANIPPDIVTIKQMS